MNERITAQIKEITSNKKFKIRFFILFVLKIKVLYFRVFLQISEVAIHSCIVVSVILSTTTEQVAFDRFFCDIATVVSINVIE